MKISVLLIKLQNVKLFKIIPHLRNISFSKKIKGCKLLMKILTFCFNKSIKKSKHLEHFLIKLGPNQTKFKDKLHRWKGNSGKRDIKRTIKTTNKS